MNRAASPASTWQGMRPPGRAVALAVVAGALAAVTIWPAWTRIIFVGISMAVLCLSWPLLLGIRPRVLDLTINAAVGATAMWAMLTMEAPFTIIAMALSGGLILSFVLELARWGSTARPLQAVSCLVSAQVTLAAMSTWLIVWTMPRGPELVLASALLIAVAALASIVTAREVALLIVVIVITGAVGGALTVVLPALPIFVLVAISVGVGGIVAGSAIIMNSAKTVRVGWGWIPAILIPIAATGMLVYGIGRFIPIS